MVEIDVEKLIIDRHKMREQLTFVYSLLTVMVSHQGGFYKVMLSDVDRVEGKRIEPTPVKDAIELRIV